MAFVSPGLILHGGNKGDCLYVPGHCLGALEIYNFLIGCPLPRRMSLCPFKNEAHRLVFPCGRLPSSLDWSRLICFLFCRQLQLTGGTTGISSTTLNLTLSRRIQTSRCRTSFCLGRRCRSSGPLRRGDSCRTTTSRDISS